MTQPATFTHRPRPAKASESYPKQRYFGKGDTKATNGVYGVRYATHISVMRWSYERTANLRIETMAAEGLSAFIEARMGAPALRELARCLLDAAADIEGEAAQEDAK